VSELKPCPWCGPGNSIVSAWFDTSSNRYRVNCGACGSSSGVPARDKSESAAIAAWNRRAAPVVTEEMVERLAKHLCREEWKDRCPTVEQMTAQMKHARRYHDEARAALTAALGDGNTAPPPADQR